MSIAGLLDVGAVKYLCPRFVEALHGANKFFRGEVKCWYIKSGKLFINVCYLQKERNFNAPPRSIFRE